MADGREIVEIITLMGTSVVDTTVELAGQLRAPGEQEVMVVRPVLYIVEVTTPTTLELVAELSVMTLLLMGTRVVEIIVELEEVIVVRPVL